MQLQVQLQNIQRRKFESCLRHADRQRTLRELEVGRTLFKEEGRWVIKHQAGDYKTGRAYGQRPPMVIAPHVYPEVRFVFISEAHFVAVFSICCSTVRLGMKAAPEL